MFSFGSQHIVVEGNTEGAPETPDTTTNATLTVVLEQLQQNGTTADLGEDANWTQIATLFSGEFTDAGLEKYISQSIRVGDDYSDFHQHRVVICTSSNTTIVVKVSIVTIGSYGTLQAWLGLGVLVLTYTLISFEAAERALIGLAAAFVTLLLLLIANKEYTLEVVATWLDQSTFVLLFGMMIIVKIFGDTGFFEWIAVKCIRLSKGSVRIMFVLICVLTAVLSAFLDNVTTVLLSSPITVKVCEVLEISPVPFLIGQALLSNIGGAATLIGDPPNIIIGSMMKEWVDFMSFIYNLAPCVLVAGFVAMGFLLFWWRHSVAGRRPFTVEEIEEEGRIKERTKFIKCCIVLVLVLVAFFLSSVLNIEPAWIALAGATALMLLTYPKHIETPLSGVEWNTLVFFAALFVLVNGMAKLGLIRMIVDLIGSALRLVDPKHQLTVAMTLILWFSALLSAIISSIPTTTTFVPVLIELAADPTLSLHIKPLIWSLSLGACFGGNGTLVGAAANVIVAGLVRSKGYFISFVAFTKVGFPTMLMTVVIANVWLISVYVGLGWGL